MRATALVAVVVGSGIAAGIVSAGPADFTDVASPNTKTPGIAVPDVLSPELTEQAVASGPMKLDNGTAAVPYYGFDGDGPMVPAPGAVQAPGVKIEASKTEPDKNTYLVLRGQTGGDGAYRYGTHFLFQGHEGGSPGVITRINLDADVPHRVTLLATADVNGDPLPTFDGSTWDPFAGKLLFTTEGGAKGGVWQATTSVPAQVEYLAGQIGQGGYEGIQNDDRGNLYIVEDSGGSAGTVNTKAKQPNSFVFRFLPTDPSNLELGGKLQVLQLTSLATPGQPIVFHAGQADADILSQDMKDIHTYGKVFDTKWVTVHDTSVDGTAPFNANTVAKAKGGTPFKRPENGVFRPDSRFGEFFFTETGDTNVATQAGADYGGFGGIFRLNQSPRSDSGKLQIFFRGNLEHTGLDNIQFLTDRRLLAVEDASDPVHTARAFDSMYLFDSRSDYGGSDKPVRILAQGRDALATLDSPLTDGRPANGFQNDGDNEITGIHVSDGDPSVRGILGAKTPRPFDSGWRVFYTQQHGLNTTYELLRQGKRDD